MPSAVIKFIISSSDSEPGYGAENLLRFANKRTKWKGKAGATQNVVILQLDREYLFTTIDIGNEYSALIEILVSRSSEENGQFYTIVPSTSFMNLTESRSEKNGNRVRIFSDLEMITAVSKQKWDVVKIVCTQPFNLNLPYGLSFVNFTTDDGSNLSRQKKETVPKIAFKLKQTSDDSTCSLAAGTMFKQKRLASLSPKDSSQNAGGFSSLNIVHNATLKVKNDDTVDGHGTPLNKEVQSKNFAKKPGFKPDVPSAYSASLNAPATTSSKINLTPKKVEVKSTVVFEKILDGVTICISGYENPLRSVLREKAVEMGASYSADWTANCTHLICAFPNTPKWRQVRSKGQIVTGKWIEKCYQLKKRLPEQKFLCR
uniref:BRCT domain-containing protein n=1 Tax=Syphacia muris TaxID=451379 RepID=A0A0N5AE60_9BILA